MAPKKKKPLKISKKAMKKVRGGTPAVNNPIKGGAVQLPGTCPLGSVNLPGTCPLGTIK